MRSVTSTLRGVFNDTAAFGTLPPLVSQGGADGFAAKLDPNGNFQWATSWGSADSDSVSGITVTQAGTVTIAGNGYSSVGGTGPQLRGIQLRQFDSSGSEQWSTFLPPQDDSLSRLFCSEIESTPSGDLVVAGQFRGQADLDPGSGEHLVTGATDTNNTFVMQLSNAGEFQWANTLTVDPGSPDTKLQYRDHAVASDGSVALLVDLEGTADIDAGGSGHLISSGATQQRVFAKYDNTGQFELSQMYDGDPALYAHMTAANDGYYVAGYYTVSTPFAPTPGVALDPVSGTAIFLMELDGDGNPVSAVGFGDGIETPGNIHTDPNGNLVLAGSSAGHAIDFDPDPINTEEHAYAGYGVAFALRLDVPGPNDPRTLFGDGFERLEWEGKWVEDSQDDWKIWIERVTEGSFSAEVDGRATDATLTVADPIDLTRYDDLELTFDWYIESSFDTGEYLALDFTADGTNWTEIKQLRGNQDQENTWHSETITIDPAYITPNFNFRYRAKVSSSREDGFVDNVRLVAYGFAAPPSDPPVALAGGPYNAVEGSSVLLDGSTSSDPDGTVVAWEWDLDDDGQYDDATGVTTSFTATGSGTHTIGLRVTERAIAATDQIHTHDLTGSADDLSWLDFTESDDSETTRKTKKAIDQVLALLTP